MTIRRTRIDPTETSTEALSVRLSANTARALAYLLDGDERSKSNVVQGAIVAAAQAKRDEMLRRESARLMADPEEVARMESMAADLEAIGVDLDELERAEGRRVYGAGCATASTLLDETRRR